MSTTIQVVKQGAIVRQYPTEHYILNILNGIVTVQDRQSRVTCAIISPNAYDYIDISEEV